MINSKNIKCNQLSSETHCQDCQVRPILPNSIEKGMGGGDKSNIIKYKPMKLYVIKYRQNKNMRPI